MLIYACSSNAGKLREFSLAGRESARTDLVIAPLPGLEAIVPPEEIGTTFEENVALKAEYYSQFTRELVLADDSGLAVDALDGAPGIHSARFAGADASSQANNELLLDKLRGVSGRSARFVCVAALARNGKVLHTARGTVAGTILESPRGENGFGYDPLFYYEPFERSFAEISDVEKLSVSARGRALRMLFGSLLNPK